MRGAQERPNVKNLMLLDSLEKEDASYKIRVFIFARLLFVGL